MKYFVRRNLLRLCLHLLLALLLVWSGFSSASADPPRAPSDTRTDYQNTSPLSADLPSDPAWKQKISSDLLQLLDPDACSPGRTPEDTAREMEVLGQLVYDLQGKAHACVRVTFADTADRDIIISYLNQNAVDPSYNVLSGWIDVQQIPSLSAISGVKQIETQILPVGSLTAGGTHLSSSFPVSGDDPGNHATNEESEQSILHSTNLSQSPEKLTQWDNSGYSGSDLRWKDKLSTDILQLIDEGYLSPGQTEHDARSLMTATGELRTTPSNASEVMITARVSDQTPAPSFSRYFSSAASDMEYGQISGWIDLANLSLFAHDPGVISIIAQIPPHASRVVTEGDDLMFTSDLRNMTNVTGKGIRIGIISDGVDSLDKVRLAGELPEQVSILNNDIGGDEGTAMLEIVHDIAPDASLYFHDRGSSQIEFVQAMDRLINEGCQIICDDITYVEPFFEDGYIARNIRDRVLSYGILYITSAGNFAREHYQAPFNGYMDHGYAWHDFQSTNGSRDLKFTAPAHSAGHIVLQWDDPFSRSSNNYDLFVYNDQMREIGRSVKIQDGDDDPMEYCRFVNDGDSIRDYYLRVVQAGGDNRTIEIYVLPLGGNPVTVDPFVPEDSMFGQQAVSEALSIGAVVPHPPLSIPEPYSSRGPVTIKFPDPELRQKPEMSAPDQVMVSMGEADSFSFSGTSASAPHIAGLAGLLWSSDPAMSGSVIRSLLLNATMASQSVWDPGLGYGVPDARLLSTFIQNRSELSTKMLPGSTTRTFKPREAESSDILTLYPGWNMVSIPYPLESGHDTGWIFSGINTTSHTIWKYSAPDRRWSAVKADESISQMDVIWVHSDDRTTISLHYDDNGGNMTARHLQAGWNPMGIPGRRSVTAADLLSPLGEDWSYILLYDPRMQQYRPAIVNGGTDGYSDERLLYPTEGFWIYMNKASIIIP